MTARSPTSSIAASREHGRVRDVHIAAAVIRDAGRLLMVRQGERPDDLFWSIPAGAAEPGEFVTDALAREVREETGIAVRDVGRLAFTVQVDDRQGGWFATVWTWDVAAWAGELRPADPDGLVVEAAWMPVDQAVDHLTRISWQSLTVRHLRGELERGSVWLRRVQPDGREEWLGSFGPGGG